MMPRIGSGTTSLLGAVSWPRDGGLACSVAGVLLALLNWKTVGKAVAVRAV